MFATLSLFLALSGPARAADDYTLPSRTPVAEAPDLTPGEIAALERRCKAGDGEACFERALVPDADGKLSHYDAMIAAACKAGHTRSCTIQAQTQAITGPPAPPPRTADQVAADAAFRARSQSECLSGASPALCTAAATFALQDAHADAQDLSAALPYLDAGCAHDDLDACVSLAGIRARAHDFAGAAAPLYGLCDRGVGSACAKLGGILVLPANPTPDLPGAVRAFQTGCGLGDAEACASLGVFYAGGKGVPKDVPHALELLDKACTAGFPDACPVAKQLRTPAPP